MRPVAASMLGLSLLLAVRVADTPSRGREAAAVEAPVPAAGSGVARSPLPRPHVADISPAALTQVVRRTCAVCHNPQLLTGNRQRLYGGMGRLTESSVLNMKNKSCSVTAEVEVPPSGGVGVIVAQGGVTGGWSLYTKDGKPKYCYNFYGLERYYIEATQAIPSGTHQVRMEFAYDGDGIGKGGTVTLYLDGQPVGDGRVEQTEPFVFSADETCDVGNEYGSPVTTDYGQTKFNGTVHWVELQTGRDDHSHLIKPEAHVHLALAIQ